MKKLRFDKQFHTYEKYATVQKKVAEKLFTFIDKKRSYNSILELGCGTGVFTQFLFKNLDHKILDLNDIFDSKEYLKKIRYSNFLLENMEIVNFKNYDLIVSSSAFQWVNDLESFLKKLSLSTSTLIFSIYIKGNLKEIDEHFGISLNYKSTSEIYSILKSLYSDVTFQEESFVLSFDTPLSCLKHLKLTGVTGFSKTEYSKVKSFTKRELTYKVAYFACNNIKLKEEIYEI